MRGRAGTSTLSRPPLEAGAVSGVHGSGTHGLHTLTTSPPPNALLTGLSGSGRMPNSVSSMLGGCTMYCLGIVILWGEQAAHTTRPHFLQWCLRNQKLNSVWQTGHRATSESGCHFGNTMSLSRRLLLELRLLPPRVPSGLPAPLGRGRGGVVKSTGLSLFAPFADLSPLLSLMPEGRREATG